MTPATLAVSAGCPPPALGLTNVAEFAHMRLWSLPSATPVTPDWLKLVAAMTPEQQLDAVAVKLKDLNPDFDGKFTSHKLDKTGAVAELSIHGAKVADLSPLQALVGLRDLNCTATQVADLSPLQDMKLTALRIGATPVSSLEPLKRMKLTMLGC